MSNQNGLNTPSPVGQSGGQIYAASATGNDTYVITLSPVPLAYINGMTINFKVDVGNTGPATLNVNTLGAIAITKQHDQALITGDIEAGQIVSVTYNSTGPKFQMQSQGAQGSNDLSGTANQINVTAAGSPQTASLSATVMAPGTIGATTITASRAMVTDASKVFTSSATTDTELGYVSGVTSAIQTQLNTKITASSADVLTNKSIDATTNTITNIANANIKAAAAIDVNKLAALTASRATVTDGSGFIAAATTTATEIGYVNGVTSAIQTQIDGKISQSGTQIYAADSVGTDAYAITLSPAPVAYTTGMVVNFKAGTANTGACSLNVNGLGAKTIKKLSATDTATGDILSGQIVTVVYDGTNFQMQSQIASPDAGGTVTSVTGTANQVSSTGGTTPVLSLPATIIAPGTIAQTTITANRAMATDVSKVFVSSATTDTELGYLSGVTSAVQTQLNARVTSVSGTANQITSSGGTTPTLTLPAAIIAPGTIAQTTITANRAMATDASKVFVSSTTTDTELGYVSGVTSAIQTQLNTKISQTGAQIYAADSGAANAYVVTLSPAVGAYTTGMVVNFIAANANTAGSTLNVNGLGAKTILKHHDQALIINDIEAGAFVSVGYDGTNFQWLSQISGLEGTILQVIESTLTSSATIAGVTETDILTLAITPSTTTSRILLIAMLSAASDHTVGNSFAWLTRSNTHIFQGDAAGSRTQVSMDFRSSDNFTIDNKTITYIDSPASASALTYKIRGAGSGAGVTMYINRTVDDANTSTTPRVVTSLTAIELRN